MPKKILLIDDDALVLKSTGNLLERQGYQVSRAKNCEDALEQIKSSHFDLIISDIRMPGKDGIETIKRIKDTLGQSQGNEIPFIFITGYASEDAPINAVKVGASDYVLKPFDNDQLMQSVEKALSQKTLKGETTQDLIKKLHSLVESYQKRQESIIFENQELKDFINELEDIAYRLEISVLKESPVSEA
ncbi:MAG: response regulator [Candidatus Omnitrophica bacterium]|nr:response regulator [Candidatus Omnitrophota bacterium]